MDAPRLAFAVPGVPRRAALPGLVLAGCAAVASALMLLPCRTAGAAEGTEWALAGEPVPRKEALEFSGAACAPDGRCLLVGDEGRRARFFTIEEAPGERPRIVIGAAVALVPAEGDGEADAEAAAFDRGRFYVLGSHGASRRKGDRQPSRYSAYRIGPDGRAESSGALARIVGAVDGIRESFCGADGRRPCPTLRDGGANIEGLAVRDGTMHLGFRAPSPGGQAFVVSVPEQAVFGQAAPSTTVSRLALGADRRGRERGIRDLAPVAGGFLVLAGPALPEGDEAEGGAVVFFWPGPGSQAVPLRPVGLERAGVKPEALLVLGEDAASYRALVIHDGVEGGAPTEYKVGKPRG
ncbi:hypothetical protein GCM10009416_00200 [Craurococcus roseus]|uniref:DUF3616 domain-containing protein n=2 Tax=Craurococcus roseus TaxID=77585 RepID=A0ABN1EGL4_9PROT